MCLTARSILHARLAISPAMPLPLQMRALQPPALQPAGIRTEKSCSSIPVHHEVDRTSQDGTTAYKTPGKTASIPLTEYCSR